MTKILALVFIAMSIATGFRLGQVARANPYGQWDAWSNWNKRAKFLALSDRWRDAASPLLQDTHPEYPMLLPAFVARGWVMSGDTAPAVPVVTAFLFYSALIAMFVGAVAMLRGTTAAMIGGMVLLSTPSLSFWAVSQYADIPLASLILGTLALLFLAPGANALAWAGVCAGLAAWMKQEGTPFAFAIVFAVLALSRFGRSRWRMAACAAPGLLLTGWFRLWIAPHGADAPHSFREALPRLVDPGRYAMVAHAFLDHVRSLGSGPGHPLILLAILAAILGPERDRRRNSVMWAGAIALCFTLASYTFAYVVSPRDLNWYIASSMDRLVLHVWPASLLLLCVLLPQDPGDCGPEAP
ncbi:MAG TPA: hypothetical protein VFC21_00305 [Bryobacteraceae bacterium]|nr:hypothetical protein [Bryobacteraceae bacterium]